MTATTRPPLFDRLAFASLVPALPLPVVAAGVVVLVASNRPFDAAFDDGFNGLVIAVFLFVLLGSMTLNAWLLLRFPLSFADRALPRHIGVMLAILYALLVAWAVIAVVRRIDESSLVFACALIVASVAVCVAALVRRGRHAEKSARSVVGLTPAARVISIGYVAAAGLALLVSLVALFVPGGGLSVVGVIGGPAAWVLVLLGLPWSWLLYLLTVVFLFTVGSSLGSAALVVLPVVLALPVAVNIAIAASIAWSPARRTAITNWFFKLTPSVLVAVEVPATEE